MLILTDVVLHELDVCVCCVWYGGTGICRGLQKNKA